MARTANQQRKAKALTAQKKLNDSLAKAEADAEDAEITSVDEWEAEVQPRKLRLPSGKVVAAVNPGIGVFLEKGLIPNSLLPLVQTAIKQGQGLDPDKAEALASSPEALADILLFARRIWVDAVKNPPSAMPPEDGKKRKSGILYTDRVDLNDLMFIMQWVVGGTRNLEQFRDEQTAYVADMEASQNIRAEA